MAAQRCRACRLTGFSRSSAWHAPAGRDGGALRARPKALAERYPGHSYPTLHTLFKARGLVTNPKRTNRVDREDRLQVRTTCRKKLTRPRVPLAVIACVCLRSPKRPVNIAISKSPFILKAFELGMCNGIRTISPASSRARILPSPSRSLPPKVSNTSIVSTVQSMYAPAGTSGRVGRRPLSHAR